MSYRWYLPGKAEEKRQFHHCKPTTPLKIFFLTHSKVDFVCICVCVYSSVSFKHRIEWCAHHHDCDSIRQANSCTVPLQSHSPPTPALGSHWPPLHHFPRIPQNWDHTVYHLLRVVLPVKGVHGINVTCQQWCNLHHLVKIKFARFPHCSYCYSLSIICLLELRFSWWWICWVGLNCIPDIVNIILWDAGSCLNPKGIVDFLAVILPGQVQAVISNPPSVVPVSAQFSEPIQSALCIHICICICEAHGYGGPTGLTVPAIVYKGYEHLWILASARPSVLCAPRRDEVPQSNSQAFYVLLGLDPSMCDERWGQRAHTPLYGAALLRPLLSVFPWHFLVPWSPFL